MHGWLVPRENETHVAQRKQRSIRVHLFVNVITKHVPLKDKGHAFMG
jgi:hypothetical protein